MKNIFDSVGYSSRKHYYKIKKILEPLTLFLNIDRFWRNTQNVDGAYSMIGNDPPKAELFFEDELYKGHPYFRHPKFFRSGFVIPGLYKSTEYENTQGKFQDSGGCFHILLYIHKHEKGFTEYGFATSKYQSGLEMTYLNHLHSFKKFIDYFETEAKNIVQESSSHLINMAGIIGDYYQIAPEAVGSTIVPKNELEFLAAIEKDPLTGRAILSLTKSEKVALGVYLEGCTARDAAETLHISPRTLEKHLENVKGKLGIAKRSELFDRLAPYKDLFIQKAKIPIK